MKARMWVCLLLSCITLFCSSHSFGGASGTLRPGDILRKGETLVSDGGVFELGFFATGGSSSNHYLGIWFKKDRYKKAVWVANRENPIMGSSGTLRIRHDGNIVITDRRPIPIIVNIGMSATSGNTTARILDTGNLVLEEQETVIWQSFDYPCDTFLPGMKLGWFGLNTDSQRRQFLTSWVSPLVPTSGSFNVGLYEKNKTNFKAWYRYYSRDIGFWDGHEFKFFFQVDFNKYSFVFENNSNEIYLTFDNRGKVGYFVLTSTGEINECTVEDEGIAVIKHKLCKSPLLQTTDACFIPNSSRCGVMDSFFETRGSMPNSMVIDSSIRTGPSDCEVMCRSNCSCTAYASFHDDGTGCELYYGEKRDLWHSIGKGSSIIYVRGDAPPSSGSMRTMLLLLAVVVPVICVITLGVILVYYYSLGKVDKGTGTTMGEETQRVSQISSQFGMGNYGPGLGQRKNHGLPLLSFSSLEISTNNFSADNKIGEGGFGPVYKGKILGHEIAVKRLSSMSRQGYEEFINEVRLISQLQHKNLVRLMGYCIQCEEKILVYEYLANRSLDSYIFDETKRKLLVWERRIDIIEGVAQGVLYLHQYSRLRIVHRDLKMSNILLDNDMNPKISDFGMARIFDEKSGSKTRKVVGTYGYMSPEYAIHGQYSTKSDVFSFGVVMLEILSGRKNTTFAHSNRSQNLLGYAWEMWKDQRYVDFMDPTLSDSYLLNELVLCIQVGLLCVQEHPKDRPTMSGVVHMLSNAEAILPTPKQPAFTTHPDLVQLEEQPSLNYLTISTLTDGR